MSTFKRFNKKALFELCSLQIKELCNTYHLDKSNGTSQLRGKDIQTVIAYSAMSLAKDLAFDLDDNNVTLNGRFSKQAALEWLDRKASLATRDYMFDSSDGWAQVEHQPINIQTLYGDWTAAIEMRNLINA